MSFESFDDVGAESNLSLTRGEAITQIAAIKYQIMTMGANDSESNSIDYIVLQLDEGRITPGQAVAEVDSIKNSKQAYH